MLSGSSGDFSNVRIDLENISKRLSLSREDENRFTLRFHRFGILSIPPDRLNLVK